MKAWNKPIRFRYCRSKMIYTRNGLEPFSPWRTDWGITNWMVGTCQTPLTPWIQISFGRINIQIKWYVVVGLLCIGSLILGLLI